MHYALVLGDVLQNNLSEVVCARLFAQNTCMKLSYSKYVELAFITDQTPYSVKGCVGRL